MAKGIRQRSCWLLAESREEDSRQWLDDGTSGSRAAWDRHGNTDAVVWMARTYLEKWHGSKWGIFSDLRRRGRCCFRLPVRTVEGGESPEMMGKVSGEEAPDARDRGRATVVDGGTEGGGALGLVAGDGDDSRGWVDVGFWPFRIFRRWVEGGSTMVGVGGGGPKMMGWGSAEQQRGGFHGSMVDVGSGGDEDDGSSGSEMVMVVVLRGMEMVNSWKGDGRGLGRF